MQQDNGEKMFHIFCECFPFSSIRADTWPLLAIRSGSLSQRGFVCEPISSRRSPLLALRERGRDGEDCCWGDLRPDLAAATFSWHHLRSRVSLSCRSNLQLAEGDAKEVPTQKEERIQMYVPSVRPSVRRRWRLWQLSRLNGHVLTVPLSCVDMCHQFKVRFAAPSTRLRACEHVRVCVAVEPLTTVVPVPFSS